MSPSFDLLNLKRWLYVLGSRTLPPIEKIGRGHPSAGNSGAGSRFHEAESPGMCNHQWHLGRSNWLFSGSLRTGQRAAVVMSLIRSAKLKGHDPYRYLKDVLERLPTQPENNL
jgi:hypothetical protein